MTAGTGPGPLTLHDIRGTFEGLVPAVLATSSADGVPNVTYLSRVCLVDDDHVAVSNQFFSKTVRNIAENPRASLLVVDPATYDEYRATLTFERTERRGLVFEHLRREVETIAAMTGMQSVFRLRGADIYCVENVERVRPEPAAPPESTEGRAPATMAAVAELCSCLARSSDLDTLVGATVDGLHRLLGYEHSQLLLLDEEGTRLYTIASHGYPTEAVGSEVPVGAGIVGLAAARCAPVRVGNLRMLGKYGRSVRQSFEDSGRVGPGHELPLPELPGVDSRLAVPAAMRGSLVGAVVVESPRAVAFDETDEAVLTIVASVVAGAIEAARQQDRGDDAAPAVPAPAPPTGRPHPAAGATRVRFYAVDGSTFFDGDYLIKGVAGRILWSLLSAYDAEGRVDFTNKEVRLDPRLELPEYRDNFENRLILLKRRLDEHAAPVRIEKTGRGRFRLAVAAPLVLESVDR